MTNPSQDTKATVAKQIRARKYLNKDFAGFKSDLLDYAKTYFPNANQDFSENSLGGLLLDMTSYVGDVQSFYLDHQFHELDPTTATEPQNVEKHLRQAGVPIVGAAPAVVSQTFYVEVPATSTYPIVPDEVAIPTFMAGTICQAENGTMFELVDNINFADRDADGNLMATVTVGQKNTSNTPTTFFLSRRGTCISGFRSTETVSVGGFVAFLKVALSKENITEIISVSDGDGNVYYEVEHLTQDTVYRAVPNKNEDDNRMVQDALVLTPAPYRFVKDVALSSRLTSLTFGGGTALALDTDIIPDPSQFAVPLYGKKHFSRFTLDPSQLLQTSTLGVLTPNTTLSITYRHGGGLSHNAIARSIRDIPTLSLTFPGNPTPRVAQMVRASVSCINEEDASGGEEAPTIDELKQRVPSVRASQSRIVSKPDALARVYTMPSNFGRVYRAALHPNPNNPLAARLYVISRNAAGQLVTSPDTLKLNLAKYLNTYRLISDALDILDAQVIDLQIRFAVVTDPTYTGNKNLLLQTIVKKIRKHFGQKRFDMDQPVVLADIQNLIFNTPGVISVADIKLNNLFGTASTSLTSTAQQQRSYSTVQYNIEANMDRGILFGPPGSIFEIRYPEYDVLGTVSS